MAGATSCARLSTPHAAAISSSRSSVTGSGLGGLVSVAGSTNGAFVTKSVAISCKFQKAEQDAEEAVSRRSALGLAALAAGLGLVRVSPAAAAYGETANIFGPAKKDTGFTTYTGEGFSLNLPAKWNPSKEFEFPGQVMRYEDNFDQLSNLSVSILPSEKKSIKDFGSPEEFLKSVSYLLGKQAYQGKSRSEGGFDPNLVASASIFKAETVEVKGKPYYYVSVLTRTGDGNEGGRHQYIVGTVADGKLYILKAQAGDKRWFKGAQKFVEGAANSFTVA